MKYIRLICILSGLLIGLTVSTSFSQNTLSSHSFTIKESRFDQKAHLLYALESSQETFLEDLSDEDLDYLEEEEIDEIADPLEPVNRFFFHVNDKLYFWVLKPVSRGYSVIVPEKARIAVRSFFDNITTPVRFVNNILQLKLESAGNELLRLGINSTLGVLGFFDFAKDRMGIKMQDEDFGQTLGKWGVGPVFYINWPILGPSSVRDTLGFAGDYFLEPVNYVDPFHSRFAIEAVDGVNRISLIIGDYEDIKKDAIDPYAAFRDIYHQYRQSKIED